MRAYTSAESSALDAAAQHQGVAGFELMRRAGTVAFERISERYAAADTLLILAGKGNNGGDAWIVAGAAVVAGWTVHLWQIGGTRLTGEAALAREWALARGVVARPEVAAADLPALSSLTGPSGSVAGAAALVERCLVVDGLLGTGLRSAPRAEIQVAIQWINDTKLRVVALDLPSGLVADNGAVPGGWPDAVVRADLTLTFIGMKLGLLTGRGPDCAGSLVHEALQVDVPRLTLDLERAQLKQNAGSDARVAFGTAILGHPVAAAPPRDRTAHKNQFGHVLVLAGDHGGGGAALLAAEAALRTGAGLVSVGTRAEHLSAMLARRPELMVRTVDGKLAAARLAEQATTIVVGPGLGQGAWGQQLFAAALDAASRGLKLVIDADALNLLAGGAGPGLSRLSASCVITPHPGEAARLLDCSSADIEADRVGAVTELARRHCCVALLKGAGTLIADPAGLVAVCTLGNPGMASAGMGDTLAGMVGSLVAQHEVNAHWVGRAVQLHAAAGDRVAARLGEASLLAADVIDAIPAVLAGRTAGVGTPDGENWIADE